HVERSVLAQHHPLPDLTLREECRRRLVGGYVGDESRRAFLDEEGDADFVGSAFYDGGIDFGFTVPALPVEDAHPQQVALQLLVIEVFPGVEVLRLADQAERLEDEAVAVRSRRVDTGEQVAPLDRLHALEREIYNFGMRVGCRSRLGRSWRGSRGRRRRRRSRLRKKRRRNE